MPLSISGGEFEAPRSMPSALHFVLQFVEQPAEFGRVLFGASKFDRPILRGGCLPEFGKGRLRKPVAALIPFYPGPTVSSTGTRGVLGSQSFRIVCPQFDSKSFPRTPAAASGGGV